MATVSEWGFWILDGASASVNGASSSLPIQPNQQQIPDAGSNPLRERTAKRKDKSGKEKRNGDESSDEEKKQKKHLLRFRGKKSEKAWNIRTRNVTLPQTNACFEPAELGLGLYTQREKLLKDEDFWNAFNGTFDATSGSSQPLDNNTKFVFHGTGKSEWNPCGTKWCEGFDRKNSLEFRSQLSRDKAVYTSNSIAHALMFGCYRSAAAEFKNPLWTYDSVVIVAEVDVNKLQILNREDDFEVKPAMCLLVRGDAFERFVTANKDPNLQANRIAPPREALGHVDFQCDCEPLNTGCSYCRFPVLMGPFRQHDEQQFRKSPHKGNYGGVGLDEIRQMAWCNDEAVRYLTACCTEAIIFNPN
jgi:hypothetical protein